MNPNYRNFTDLEIYEIERLAKTHSQLQLAKHFKTSHQTISKTMKKNNIKGLFSYRGIRYKDKEKPVKVKVVKGEMFDIDKYKGNIIF